MTCACSPAEGLSACRAHERECRGLQDAAGRGRMHGSTFQTLAKALAAVSIFSIWQLARIAAGVGSTCPDCTVLLRGLQSVLAVSGVLSLLNINMGKK